ncbi:hypothetical protein HDU93_007131 [Gonapodya sp. JEL0774]|nr:hypothetical protein HDU93_007131 [Gonapodya sp. JEL0774]
MTGTEPTHKPGASASANKPSGRSAAPIPTTRLGKIAATIRDLFGEGKVQDLGEDYVAKRRLGSKVASAYSIYSLPFSMYFIGCIVSWTDALAYGWGSFLISFFIGAIGVWLQALANAEMTAAFPFTGGQTTWGTAAFGSVGGVVMGQIDMVFWILNSAACMGGCGRYAARLFGFSTAADFMPAVWTVFLVIINVILSFDVKISMRIFIAFAIWAMAFYVVWFFSAVPSANYTANIANGGLSASELVMGDNKALVNTLSGISFVGVFQVLPYIVWMFGGYEATPLMAEEAVDIRTDIAKVTYWTLGSSSVLGLLSLVVAPVAAPGLVAISQTPRPNALNMLTAWGSTGPDAKFKVLAFLMMPIEINGLMASLFACSRSFYANSRAGYLPTFISLTSKSGSPYVSMITVSIVTLVVNIGMSYAGDDDISKQLAVFLILIYECMGNLFKQFIYLRLHYAMPRLPRPFKAPFTVTGAIAAAVILIITTISIIVYQKYTWLLMIILGSHMGFASILYVVYIKNKLLMTPEKLFIKEQLNYMFHHATGSSIQATSTGTKGAAVISKAVSNSAGNDLNPSGTAPRVMNSSSANV